MRSLRNFYCFPLQPHWVVSEEAKPWRERGKKNVVLRNFKWKFLGFRFRNKIKVARNSTWVCKSVARVLAGNALLLDGWVSFYILLRRRKGLNARMLSDSTQHWNGMKFSDDFTASVDKLTFAPFPWRSHKHKSERVVSGSFRQDIKFNMPNAQANKFFRQKAEVKYS